MPKRHRAEQTEAAAIRRRWITLGEVLAVAAVVISGLTFWNSYQERSSAEQERAAERQAQAAEKRKQAKAAQTLLLKGSGGGKVLRLAALDRDQAIQSQTLAFPAALGVERIDTVIEPRIEAGWIERAVQRARKAAGDGGRGSGDALLPVAITTRFVRGGETYSDTAIYDVGYKLDSGLLDTDVELLGLSLVERTKAEAAQARLDAVWKARQPKPAEKD
ncbi:MAG TPA: hypothetical protein VGW34_01925 [Allosphingosinicella sp.]|nr:hypothetical protein [Allosphingosinicella sp.]